jgi:methylenetetrahydrofolate reductase (NADPH)
VRKFAEMNGARVPPRLWERLELAASPAERLDIAVDHATELCRELLAEGVAGIHLYTLNQSDAASRIVANLGVWS